MTRYANGKVYKIVNSVNDEFYVGSTCMPLSKRLSGHRTMARRGATSLIYRTFNELGLESFRIILIEAFPCETKEALLAREQHYIDELNPPLNKKAALGQYCVHNKRRTRCADCGGSEICQHRVNRDTCAPCHGRAICPHGRHKPSCRECHGSAVCEHDLQKRVCRECHGSGICEHLKSRQACIVCSPATCEICEIIMAKASMRKHLTSARHMANSMV